MSNIADENLSEMEQDLAAPVESFEEESQSLPAVSEEGGEDATGDGTTSGGSGSGSNP
jgi:hypothetical protein